MIRAFIIQQNHGHTAVDKQNFLVDEVKRTNPDRIILITLGEINVTYDYEHFFKGIASWLIEKNVICHVLWAGPNVEIFPNVQGVNTLGSAVGNQYCTNGAANIAKRIDFPKTCDKLYTCYNNNPKYERKYLVDFLAKNDLLKDGIVTYHFPNVPVNYSWQHHDGSRLFDEENYKISSEPQFSPGLLPQNYFRGFIDIVCETDTQEGYFIPTEKTAKPWGAGKPYLVVSSVNYHQWLFDEYGIEPYTEMFDYSFDKELMVGRRIQAIIRNLKVWRDKFAQNPNAKENIYKEILPKIKHNRTMALQTIKTLKAKNKVIPNCLRFITQEPYELLGENTNNGGGIHFLTDPIWHKDNG